MHFEYLSIFYTHKKIKFVIVQIYIGIVESCIIITSTCIVKWLKSNNLIINL